MLFQGYQYDKLNQLMNELDDHYELQLMELLQQDPNVRTPASFSVGDPVASVWETDNLWYRGVVRGNKMGKWEVFNVDYGDTHLVGEPFIMPLDRNFCVFPAQAIRATSVKHTSYVYTCARHTPTGTICSGSGAL